MKNEDLKKRLVRNLTIWMDSLELNEGEGLYVYSTKDRLMFIVHLSDGSYREDIVKSLKEIMGK